MTEKESLLVLNQEIKSDLSFCRDCAVSQGATGWVKDFDRLLDKNEILNNKLNQQFSSRSKLSIPKNIAEELDMILKEYPGWIYEGFHRLASRSLMMWCENNSGFNNCVVYLAGKALGVELVEVTDE